MARFLMTLLGSSKQNCDWHIFTVSTLFVRKSFIKNLFITKSRDIKSVFVSGQASREYSKIGRHLLLTNCNRTSSEDVRPTLPKIALTARWKAHLA